MTPADLAAERMLVGTWTEISVRGLGHLDRVRGYLFNMLDGEATPENRLDRELFGIFSYQGSAPGHTSIRNCCRRSMARPS